MDTFNNFSKFSFRPIIFTSSKFDYNCCNLTKKISIRIPKIVNIPFANTNDYLKDLYSKIPHHSQR